MAKPTDAAIGDVTEGRRTRKKSYVDYNEMTGMISMACYTSATEPKNFKEAIDEY